MPTRHSVPAATSAARGRPSYYRIVPQTPPLPPHELESVESAIEVVIVWGGLSVLHVAHLSPPRAFYAGETGADFPIGADTLGAERLPIVLASGGAPSFVVPAAASGELERAGEAIGFDALEAQGLLRPVPGVPGARQHALANGTRARIQCGELTFIVRAVAAGVRVGADGGVGFAWRRERWMLASVGLHLALLALFYALPPRSQGLSIDTLHTSSRLVPYSLLTDEPPEPPPNWLDRDRTGAAAPGGGARARDDSGQAGAPDAPKRARRIAVAGPRHDPDPQLAPAAAPPSAPGILGILRASAWNLPAAKYDRARAEGYDAESAIGELFTEHTGTAFGFHGLGPRGTGRGGGGHAEGTIGTGELHTGIGGNGPGGSGYGATAPGGFREREARVPRVRLSSQVDTFGSLSKDVIRRVIGRHVNEVRHCYSQQLIARPDLQGRVSVRFTIAPTGAVMMAQVADSDVGDVALGRCVAQAVKRWVFPAPEGGGVVFVTYPFVFSPVGG